MAYLHCLILTRIQTRIRTPDPMATLGYAMQKFLHCSEPESDSNPNCQLQEWDQNPSPHPSPSPSM